MTRKVRTVTAGPDGRTSFGEREVEFHTIDGIVPGGVFDAAPLGANDVALVRFAPGFVSEYHLTPSPTWMFILAGRLDLGTSDGEWAELGPGDIVHMSDTSGEGHRSRVLGDDDLVLATAGFGG